MRGRVGLGRGGPRSYRIVWTCTFSRYIFFLVLEGLCGRGVLLLLGVGFGGLFAYAYDIHTLLMECATSVRTVHTGRALSVQALICFFGSKHILWSIDLSCSFIGFWLVGRCTCVVVRKVCVTVRVCVCVCLGDVFFTVSFSHWFVVVFFFWDGSEVKSC